MKIKLLEDKAIVRFKNQNEKILFAQWMYDLQAVMEEENYDVKIKNKDGKTLKKRKVVSKGAINNEE